ncbi:MAG: CBS domain-containing protein [Terriglobia bacterium]
MKKNLIFDEIGLTKEQLDLIEHFEADYNKVDHFLRNALGRAKHVPFTRLLDEYLRHHPGWHDADLLKMVAGVRNAIVHCKTNAYQYVAVPTPTLGEELRACRDRLTNPPHVIPAFKRRVETVSIDDTLARVLRLISLRDYSQFPVYDAERFQGLLTENGITRWLADHIAKEISLIELEGVSVRHVLLNEEKRPNFLFVSQDMLVDDVKELFASHELLEAGIITLTGKRSESLLGIATRWDMIQIT